MNEDRIHERKDKESMRKGRAPCCDKTKVTKGPWSPLEDSKLISHIQKFGHRNWRALPNLAGLSRCGKSCRLRWINYLKPGIKRGNISHEEETTIIKLHKEYGNKWSKIASHLPGRTDNEIKNVWNTHLKKKLNGHEEGRGKASETKKAKSLPVASVSSSSSSATSTMSMAILHDKALDKAHKSNTNSTKMDNGTKDILSPSASSTSDTSRLDQKECLSKFPKKSSVEVQDDLSQSIVDTDMEIWYMIEGMGSVYPYNDTDNLQLNAPQEFLLSSDLLCSEEVKGSEAELRTNNSQEQKQLELAENYKYHQAQGSCFEASLDKDTCPVTSYLVFETTP